MVCALVSLFTGLCVPVDIAMTGEVRPSNTIPRLSRKLIALSSVRSHSAVA